MPEPTQAQLGHAARDLDALLASGRGRIVPANETGHTGRCDVCALDVADLVALERGFVGWTSVSELAQLYNVSAAAVQRHAFFYSLHLFRAASVSTGYARMIAAGLAKLDDITPELALRALVKLDERTAPAGGPGAGPADPAGQVAQSWEAEVRTTTTRRTRSSSEARPPEAVVINQPEPGELVGPPVPAGSGSEGAWPEP